MMSRQLLMGKKNINGDLGHVWMAAHFPKRINKQLVNLTNITSSVDKILVDQLPVVTYRILGYLLLGVVRIYSKQVEYMLIDCNHSQNEMKLFCEGRKKVDINFGGMCLPESSSQRSKLRVAVVDHPESSRRNSNAFIDAMRAQFSSISLPDHFELDTFNLEVHEDDSTNSSNDHVRPHLELVLHDPWEDYQTERHTSGKDHASASTSAMITIDNTETSVEKLRNRFVMEERLDPMVLSDSDDEALARSSSPLTEQQPEWNTNTDSSDKVSDSVKDPDKHSDEERTTTGPTVVSEMSSGDNIMLKPSPNKSQLSVTIDMTPQSKAPDVSGERKSELMAVRTPAFREDVRAPRKRKCIYDSPLVVPNRVYETWVSNASGLSRKRRTPATVLDRKEHISFDYFSQPIIPINACFSSDLRSVISTKELVAVKEVEKTVDPPISKNDELESLVPLKISEETEAEVLAPSTPLSQSTSLWFNDRETSKVNQVGPTSSCESGEKIMHPNRDVNMDEVQREEGPSYLGEDGQEYVSDPEKWSAVTKSVGGLLHSNFVDRKEKREEEVVNLSQILKQKTKKESARFFYQTLVLKTGGYIDVKQEKPYGEICVKETAKLKEAFGSGSRE